MYKNEKAHTFSFFFFLVMFFTVLQMGLFIERGNALDPSLAKTPPMGWNSWNIFGGNISDSQIRQIADAIVSSGMKDAGYIYINLDDNWMKAGRDSAGNLVPDPTRFPNGIKGLADYVHSKGLKLGIYGDRGTATCMGVSQSGGQGHEQQDANSYAAWGVDYLKYDNCNASLSMQQQYATMGQALASCGRPIVYSICAWEFQSWMPSTGNLWRTTRDINDKWTYTSGCCRGLIEIIDLNAGYYASAGPGHWNDPDMLEVGNGGMTDTEYRSHFSLWCIMAAPLIAGNDVRNMSQATKNILLNTEAIAVDQDPLGVQGRRVRDNGDYELWVKPLKEANGPEKAVVLFNRSTSSYTMSFTWSEIGIPNGPASIRDLWQHQDLGINTNNSFSVSVPGHGVVMLKVVGNAVVTPTPTPSPTPTPQQNPIWTGGPYTLNGTSDYADLPDGITNNLGDFSIACWVKLNTVTNWARIFDFGGDTNIFMMLTPQSGTTGFPYFAITTTGNSGEQGLNGTNTLPTGSWQHLAVVKSGDTGILYINKQEVARNTSMTLRPADLGNTTNNYIGKSQWSQDPYLNGSIDQVKIYNRAINVGEVTILASTPPGGVTGDVNGDGSVTIVDAMLIAQYVSGLNPAGFNSANADANCDGSININDALLVARYAAGLLTKLGC